MSARSVSISGKSALYNQAFMAHVLTYKGQASMLENYIEIEKTESSVSAL